MERRREQLQQEGACIERPLGRPKLAPLSLSYPSTPSLQSSGKPLEAPPALSEPTPHSHIASATSHPDVQPTEHPTASPTPPEPATSIAPSSSAFHLPRITTRGWDVAALCRDFKSFEHVRRVSALSEPAELLKTLENYERDGLPLIIDNWDKHSKWPADVFNIDWLLQTAGDQHIHVRNVHDRQDRSMTLSEFVNISRAQSCHSSPGESQRLYWKDADCPPKWREWLLKSGAIPTPVLPGSPDDYLGYLFPSETVESLLCYMGVGDTYTAAHKDLCASSGHNLMCFSEQGGSSFWFMTAANDAPEVAKYFHQELGQELDWETHVTSIEELGRAPFKVYIAEQKVGDLVLVPPRSCHQVVNHGGLAMKTSWSRMTLDNLKTALHCELPIYHRVCRPEQYRVKTVLYRSMLHLTEMLQAALTPTPGPEPDPRGELAVTLEPDDIVGPLDAPEAFNALANYGDSPSSSSRPSPDPSLDLTERALKLKRLVQLFDEVLRAEFVSTHAKLEHIFRSDTSAGWGLTASSSTSSSAEKSTDEGSSSGGLKLFLQPPTAPSDRRENDKLKERAASCNLACDFCGADIFQSFFECKQCRTPEPGVMPQVGDGLLLCAACYVEGRICECEEMEPVQCRPFEVLLSDRNLAAKAVSALLPPDEDVQELQERDLRRHDDICIFEAACAFHIHRRNRQEGRLEKLKCRTDNHEVPAVEALNCKLCHGSRCFRCLLEQGTHSAEAIYEYQRSAPSCIRWHKRHVANLDNLKTFRTDQKLFNLDDASTMKERLRIAASSFPKCRPGHAKVKLGFYDCENEGGDLFAEEIEDAVPPETDIVKPDMFVMTEEMSPLTPDEDSSMDSILGDPPSKDADISISAAQPPLSLSSNTVVDEDEVISITSSSSSSSSSHPGPATTGPEITVPRNDVTVATGDNPIPKAEVYVWLPPKPHYAVIVKRASSPSRDVVASRKKPRSVSLRDAEGSSHGRDRNARVGQLPRAHSAQVDDSVDSDRDGVASNMAAEGLVRSLSMANGAPPIFTQSSPKAKRPIVSAHRRKMVIESDSETASPPAEQDTVALTSASVAQPPRPRPEHPRRSSLSNTSLKEPAASSSVAPSPQLPRTYALKRARLEESVEVGKTAQQTSNSSAAPGTAPSSVSGRAPKKRKGPPGYTAEEVEKMKAAEVAEQFARRERKIQSGKLTVRTQVPRESTVPVPRDADTMRPPTAPNARNASAPVNTTRTETRDAAPASVHASTSSIADGVSFSATSGPLHPVVALSPRAPIPPPIPLSGNAENESPVRPSGSLHQLLIATQDIAQRWAAFEESLRYMVEIEEKSRTDRQYWEEQFASLRKMLEDRDKEAKRVLEEKDKSINKLQEEVQGLNKEMRIIKEELHARAKELRSLQDAHEKVRQQQEVSNLAIVKNQTDIITLFNISATHDLQQQIRDIALEVVRSAQTQIRCTQHAPAEVPPPADIRPSQPLPTAMPQHTSRQDNWRGQQGPNPDARGLVNGSTRGAADHLPPRGSFGEWYPAQDQSEQRRSRRWDHRGGQRGLEQSDQHRRGGSHYHDTWGASSNGDSWDDRGSREYHPRGGDYRRRSGSRSRSPRRAQSSRPPPTGPRAEREASVVSDKSDKQRTVSVKADTPPSTIELFPSSASSSGKPNPSYSSIQESSFTEEDRPSRSADHPRVYHSSRYRSPSVDYKIRSERPPDGRYR